MGSKLIVVLGHSRCGAVGAACDNVQMGNLTTVLAHVQPAVQMTRKVRGDGDSSNSEFVQAVAEQNARLAVEQLPDRSPIIRDLLEKGAVEIVAAMYDVATGRVQFLDKPPADLV